MSKYVYWDIFMWGKIQQLFKNIKTMKLESQMAMLQQFDPDHKNTKQKIRFYVFLLTNREIL